MKSRIHFLDSARAILMFLGIPYHAGLLYAPLSDSLVPSPDGSRFLEVMSEAIHIFRMPIFFLVAGYFGAMLLERMQPAVWYRARLVRLCIPLVAGMLLLNPIVVIAIFYGPGGGKGDLVATLTTAGGYGLWHLWFLPVLVGLCGLLALMETWGAWRILSVFVEHVLRRPVRSSILIFALWGPYGGAVMMAGSRAPDFFFATSTVVAMLGFLPYFLIGSAMRRSRELFDRLTSASLISLAIPAAAVVLLLATDWSGTTAVNVLRAFALPVAAIGCGRLLFAGCRRWLNEPSRTVTSLVDASFTVYLFHMPLLGLLGLLLVKVRIFPPAEWAFLVALVTLLSMAVHQC
ncbi:MAG: acyltransferase family protein [Variovorax sp.]